MVRKWYKIPAKDEEEPDDGKEPNFFPVAEPDLMYAQQIDDDYFYVLLYQSIPFQELTREEVEAEGIDFDRTITGGEVA